MNELGGAKNWVGSCQLWRKLSYLSGEEGKRGDRGLMNKIAHRAALIGRQKRHVDRVQLPDLREHEPGTDSNGAEEWKAIAKQSRVGDLVKVKDLRNNAVKKPMDEVTDQNAM
jgi:hypothetical protein